jgi:hypothetical protein
MPTDHGLRLENFQCVQDAGGQPIEGNKYQAVSIGEDQALRRLAAQHVELMSKHEDFGLQRRSRPDQPVKASQISLQRSLITGQASADSLAFAKCFRFAVGTGEPWLAVSVGPFAELALQQKDRMKRPFLSWARPRKHG